MTKLTTKDQTIQWNTLTKRQNPESSLSLPWNKIWKREKTKRINANHNGIRNSKTKSFQTSPAGISTILRRLRKYLNRLNHLVSSLIEMMIIKERWINKSAILQCQKQRSDWERFVRKTRLTLLQRSECNTQAYLSSQLVILGRAATIASKLHCPNVLTNHK